MSGKYYTDYLSKTAGRNLTVNGASASIQGDGTANGRLDVNTGGTVAITNLDQSNTTAGLASVLIGSGTTVSIAGTHNIGRYSSYDHTCNISGGTVTYTATGTANNILQWLPQNTGSGWYATGGTTTFYGSLATTFAGAFSATGGAVVIFAGSASSVYNTAQNSGGGGWIGVHTFSDLRIQKTGGASLTFQPSGSVYLNGNFIADRLTVNSGAAFTLNQNYFGSGYGYVFGNVANDGTITINAVDNGVVKVSGDWTGTGTLNGGNKLVQLTGTSSANLALGGGFFYDLTLSRPGGGALMTGDVTVARNLVLTAGTFAAGENDLVLGTAGASGSATVGAGCTFTAVGAGFARGSVRAASESYPYAFGVAAAGTVGAKYADFRYMNTSGLVVASGATIDPADNFSHCSFDHGALTGPMLSVANNQVINNMDTVDFLGSAGYNIDHSSGTGHLTVVAGSGTRWGEDYDNDPSNLVDWLTPYYDAGVVSLTAPRGTYLPGYTLQPIATWRNNGNTAADFDAWMCLSDPTDTRVYAEKVSLTGIAPGTPVQVNSFPTVQLSTPGPWTVRCSTYMVADGDPNNDLLDDDFFVGAPDMAVAEILAPAGSVDTNEVVTPSARLYNDGDVDLPFSTWFIMNDPTDAEVYREQIDVAGLAPGADTVLEFPDHNVGQVEGRWSARCSVYVMSDQDPANDYRDGAFDVKGTALWPAGWQEVRSLPGAIAVKDGGWLTAGPDRVKDGVVLYAAKGNKTTEFLKYNPIEDTWNSLAPINADEGGREKPPKKGCAGVSDGENCVYLTKGNNTLGFWKYDIERDSWTRLPDVPAGPAGKRVKGGTDLAYAVDESDSGWVYLMKGYKTEFYRFNLQGNRWDTLDDVPYGVAPKYNAGSFLVADGSGYLYAHQAKYTDAGKTRHYMFRYDLTYRRWDDSLVGMPVLGKDGGKMKSKKSKDGGSGAWYDGRLYALKGGNTCQYYRYEPSGDTWTELDTLSSFGSTAKKKKVKAGGDLVSYGGGAFFALKGNKTNEFWRYVEPTGADRLPLTANRTGVMSERAASGKWRMAIAPNPIANGLATVRIQGIKGPRGRVANLRIFDAAGRCLKSETFVVRTSDFALPLDMRRMSNGVYLVRFDAEGCSLSQKLVVQR